MKYFALIICLFSFACKKTDNTITESPEKTARIPINTCTAFAKNKKFSICYDSLLFDNRCPDVAMCARRGEVGVNLSFKQNNNTITFRLADFSSIFGNISSDTTINGVHIKLIDVLPHRYSNQNIEKKVILEIN